VVERQVTKSKASFPLLSIQLARSKTAVKAPGKLAMLLGGDNVAQIADFGQK